MNSFWIEQLARGRIDDFATEARGDQLVRGAAASESRPTRIGRRPTLRPRAWWDALTPRSRSRRPVARAR